MACLEKARIHGKAQHEEEKQKSERCLSKVSPHGSIPESPLSPSSRHRPGDFEPHLLTLDDQSITVSFDENVDAAEETIVGPVGLQSGIFCGLRGHHCHCMFPCHGWRMSGRKKTPERMSDDAHHRLIRE